MIKLTTRERTKKQAPQVSIDAYLNEGALPHAKRRYTYAQCREFGKDATVALVREVAPGPILAANWTIEGEDGARVELVKENILKIRNEFLVQAVRGLNDFGWMPFEKVWEKDADGFIKIKKLKALLHEDTNILVDKHGAFVGFRQTDLAQTQVPLGKCLLLSQDVEGTNWYGTGKLEVAGRVVNDWNDSNEGANRYDKKIAGSHWVVHYPIGFTEVKGEDIDNYDLAGDILAALESSGKMRIPASVQSHIEDMNESGESAWKIETISDNTARQHSFVARQEYLDRLKVRGYGFPEDTILKTRYSPKTEQGVHANIMATIQDVQHQYIVSVLNEEVVDPTLVYNYGKGAEGSVYILPAPITNTSLGFLQDVYKMLINNQAVAGTEYNHIDMVELKTKIAVPNDGETEVITNFIDQTPKAVEDATDEASFKSEGVQN